jgi:dTDP-4-dehydrorhamnose 3,5-epimerase
MGQVQLGSFVAPPKAGLCLEDFAADTPWSAASKPRLAAPEGLIDGVVCAPLISHRDERGGLTELLTVRSQIIEPIVHVYEVTAAPGALRAWVYHERQEDRLAYTNGRILVVLYDIRKDSPTRHRINTLELGADAPALLTIPRFVIHGVKNIGTGAATFINLPTAAYDPARPDKRRIAHDDPRIPYRFED